MSHNPSDLNNNSSTSITPHHLEVLSFLNKHKFNSEAFFTKMQDSRLDILGKFDDLTLDLKDIRCLVYLANFLPNQIINNPTDNAIFINKGHALELSPFSRIDRINAIYQLIYAFNYTVESKLNRRDLTYSIRDESWIWCILDIKILVNYLYGVFRIYMSANLYITFLPEYLV